MVTQESARQIGDRFRDVSHFPSDTNHRNLVRFEHPREERYQLMVEKLQEMAAEAPGELQRRARSGYFGGAIQVGK
jgi:hypothetical protein